MKLKITARAAADAHLPAGKDEEIFWDADGLGLRLRRRGDGDGTVKTWIVQWKKHGRTRKVTLGKTGGARGRGGESSGEEGLGQGRAR